MNDRNMKLSEELKMIEEANCIMEEINSDPNMKDVQAPEDIYDKLFQQIRQYEDQISNPSLSQEDKELIRLGKLYKKRRRWNMYLILAAAMVLVLGVCMTSMGGTKKVLQEVSWWLAGREQSNVDTDIDRIERPEVVSEVEAYEQIEKAFGFYPVCVDYLPDGMEFCEMVLEGELQKAQIVYEGRNEEVIVYRISPNYRDSSMGTDVEDEFIKEYKKEVKETTINVKQYWVEKDETQRWKVTFVYKDVQYSLMLTGLEENEVEKMVENLYFS